MRAAFLAGAFALAVFSAGCASQPQDESALNADERVICRNDRELGSLRSRRVCKTAAEWESDRAAQQEGMRGIGRPTQAVASPGDDGSGG